MKFKLFLVIAVAVLLMSCMKVKQNCSFTDSAAVADTSEINYLKNYFVAKNITNAIQHPSGAFYIIKSVGTGINPELCNTIAINYTAYQLNYAVAFDSYSGADGVPFKLGNLIVGVQKITPLIKSGGSVTMYIPPSLAYKDQVLKDKNNEVVLSANSYIRFDMTLKSVY